MAEGKTAKKPDDHAEEPGAGKAVAGGGFLKKRLKLILAAVAALAVLGAATIYFLPRHSPEPDPEPLTAEMALECLDRGEVKEARRLANLLRDQETIPEEQLGTLAFVQGTLLAREAEELEDTKRRKAFLLAANYLGDARVRRFPEGHETEGIFLLGKSLHESGQTLESREVLRAALESAETCPAEARYLLAAGYLREFPKKAPEALQENRSFLDDARLTNAQRRQGLLQRAEILLKLKRLPECRETLAQIPPGKSLDEVRLLEGRNAMEEARALASQNAEADRAKAGEKYKEAINLLQQAHPADDLNHPTVRKAAYLMAVCTLEMGDRSGALKQFDRVHTVYPSTPEALAADLAQADLLRQLGRVPDALDAYERVLKTAADPETPDNPWLTPAALRRRMLEAYQSFFDGHNYAACLRLANALVPPLSKAEALQRIAEVHQSWGRDLVEAENQTATRKEAIAREARSHLRKAGEAFEQLAMFQRVTREYPDSLWKSANAYLDGHDYASAVRMFQQYLDNERDKARAPALLGLGRSLLAIDRVDDAIQTLEDEISRYPYEDSTYRARMICAQAWVEKGDVSKAEQFLEANLTSDALTPESIAWRESLFLLGEILHRTGRYSEAIRRLEEAVKRYGEKFPREALAARYLIADSYYQSAQAEKEKLKQDVVEEARLARTKQIRELLSTALEQYRQAQDAMLRYQETHELTALEKTSLRNGFFAVGGLLSDLGQPDAALKAYASIAGRYQSAPEVLDAYLQMARIQERLQHPTEARAMLEQAKVVLSRLKPQTDFLLTTNHSRKEWTELLDRLTAEESKPKAP